MVLSGSSLRLKIELSVLIASLAANVLALALPLVMIQVYDRIIPRSGFETLAVLSAGLLVAALADFLLRMARGRLLAIAGARFETAAYDLSFRSLLRFDALDDRADQGVLSDRLANIERLRRHHSSEAATAVLDVPFIVIFVSVMTLIAPALGVAICAITICSLLIVFVQRRQILRLNLERQERDARRHSFLAETIESIEMIKSLGIETPILRRFEWFMSVSAAITCDLTRRINFTQGVISSISLAAPILIAGIGSYLVVHQQMSAGGLAAAVLLTSRIIQPTLRMEAMISGERDIRRSRQDLKNLVEAADAPTGQTPLEQVLRISLDRIAVRENAAPGPAIELYYGDCVLLSGTDGADRSALLAAIAGHATPLHGEVRLNGMPTRDFSADDLQDRISLLRPDYTMLSGTLLDNLTCFEVDKYHRKALELCEEMGIASAISRHADGLSADVAAHGADSLPKSVHDGALLVAGLVKSPDVILFDEANAGLDLTTDARMIEMLRRRIPHSITVIVSHRPSYQALANRHLILDAGSLRLETASQRLRESAS